MEYDYIQHTINGVPLDVYVDSNYKSVWLSPGEMSCLFAVDVNDIKGYIDEMLRIGLINKGKDYDEEKDLCSIDTIAFVGMKYKSSNLKPFVDWAMKFIMASNASKNLNSNTFTYLVECVISIDHRINNLCKETS